MDNSVLLYALLGLNALFILIVLVRGKPVPQQDKINELTNQYTRLQVESEHYQKEKSELHSLLEAQKGKNKELKIAIDQLTLERNSLLIKVERFTIENDNLKQAYATLEQLLAKLRQDLNIEFAALKNQAVDALKLEAGISLRNIGKDELIAPLDKTLKQLQNDIIALQTETKAINQSSIGLNLTAQHLAEALTKDSKKKGDFGELILANILESVGLQEKISYLEQEHISYEGSRHIPDMVINLPDNRALIIDSKNIIGASYESASSGVEQPIEIHRALERAINDLAPKKYAEAIENKLGKQVFEYMVLFIPNEGLFNQILHYEHNASPNLIEVAYKHKIIISGPSTILMLVALIDKMWRTAQTDERALHIIKLAGDLTLKLKTTLEALTKLGNSLRNSVNSYNDLIGSFDNGDTRSAMSKLASIATNKDLPINYERVENNLRAPASTATPLT